MLFPHNKLCGHFICFDIPAELAFRAFAAIFQLRPVVHFHQGSLKSVHCINDLTTMRTAKFHSRCDDIFQHNRAIFDLRPASFSN
jgi:hypothetical protein